MMRRYVSTGKTPIAADHQFGLKIGIKTLPFDFATAGWCTGVVKYTAGGQNTNVSLLRYTMAT